MTYSIRFELGAISDMQLAYEWYEEQKQGLGDFFLEELEASFEKICAAPLFYTIVGKNFRRIQVQRFPYLVIYEIENDRVIINAIRHTSRRPKF